MQTLAAHPTGRGLCQAWRFAATGSRYENAGAALLDTCKGGRKGKDPVQIGSYRGFTMSVAFDSMWKCTR